MSANFRFVICVDVEADGLKEAYRSLYKHMGLLPEDMEWESTDEWYDEDGEQGDPDVLQDVRMTVFDEEEI